MKKILFSVTNRETSLFPLVVLGEVIFFEFPKFKFGYTWNNYMIGRWQNRVNNWAMDEADKDQKAQKLIKDFKKYPRRITLFKKGLKKSSEDLLQLCRQFKQKDLNQASNRQLADWYQQYVQQFKEMYKWGWVVNAIEGDSNIFSRQLQKIITRKLKTLNQSDQSGLYFSVLTTLVDKTSERVQADVDLLKILDKIKKNKWSLNDFPVQKLLNKHTDKYSWLNFNYEGPALSQKYFFDQLKNIYRQNPKQALDKIVQQQANLNLQQKQLAKKLDIKNNPDLNFRLKLARWLFFLKDWRKNVLYQSYYYVDFLLKEIARRLYLTPTAVRHILPREMTVALLKNQYDPDLLEQRIKLSVVIFSGKKFNIYTGKEAQKIIKKNIQKNKQPAKVNQLTGQVAYSGRVLGRVKLVLSSQDNSRMKKGEILVSEKTEPSLMPAINKAAAIITNTGGMTCHAAIVARELRIPCVIGTKIATKVLKDGDKVEVNADKGIVKKLLVK